MTSSSSTPTSDRVGRGGTCGRACASSLRRPSRPCPDGPCRRPTTPTPGPSTWRRTCATTSSGTASSSGAASASPVSPGTGDALVVTGTTGAAEHRWRARHVVSATGTWSRPFVPAVPGRERFAGRQLHSATYLGVEDVRGARVLVVGGGNSGAQLMAEVSAVADATWVTLHPPRFLPDDVDGRRLFEIATARRRALAAGGPDPGGVGGLGDVVAVASVREARDAGRLRLAPMIAALTSTGAVGRTAPPPTSTSSCGAPGSGPSCRTCTRSVSPRSTATRVPTAPTARTARPAPTSPGCISSGTATGPAPRRPPSSGSARPPRRPRPASRRR